MRSHEEINDALELANHLGNTLIDQGRILDFKAIYSADTDEINTYITPIASIESIDIKLIIKKEE